MLVKVTGKTKVYPHKEKCCYYEAYDLNIEPEPEEGIIGGFFDELFKLKKGKVYEINIKEVKL